MPRIRTIKPAFWKDQKISKFKRDVRLMFIGLWNLADDEGVIHGDASLIKSEIFPFDEDLRVSTVNEWIDQLIKARLIIPFIYNDESYYLVRTFKTHQTINRPQESKIPEEIRQKVFTEYAVNDTGAFTVGMEWKGREGNRKGKEGEADEPPAPEKEKKKFVKPTKEELTDYFISLNIDDFSAQAQGAKFFDHYESNGWKIGGKTPMKDWQAAARNWKERMKDFKNNANGKFINGTSTNTKSANANDFLQRAKDDFNAFAGRTTDTGG